jgi:hypothetical protein
VQQISFAEDPHHAASGVDDRHSADVVIDQKPHRCGDIVVRADGYDVADHDIAGVHIHSFRARAALAIVGARAV